MMMMMMMMMILHFSENIFSFPKYLEFLQLYMGENF